MRLAPGPWALLVLALCLSLALFSSSSCLVLARPSSLTPPVWPDGFNATLMKIGADSYPNDITFTKLWYTNESSRFDFFTSYVGLDQQWKCNFTILFTPVQYEGEVYPMIYHIYPDGGPGPLLSSSSSSAAGAASAASASAPPSPTCYIRANNIPNISPNWLSTFTFQANQLLRGVPVQWWQLEADTSLNYFNRPDDDTTPVRSTNQANDPGATDYSDYLVGPQDDAWFEVPTYCPPPVPTKVNSKKRHHGKKQHQQEWIDLLPEPFKQHVKRQRKITLSEW